MSTFRKYKAHEHLGSAFDEDVRLRFSIESDPDQVADALTGFVRAVGESRNLGRF